MAKIPNGKPRPKAKKGTFKRLLKTVFSFYPVLLPLTLCCIVFSAVVASMPSLFMERVFAAIEQGLDLARGNEELGIVGIGGAAAWNEVKGDVQRSGHGKTFPQ